MNRLARLALAAAACAAAAVAHAENPRPGQWSNRVSMSPDGVHWKPMPPHEDCLTPAQAQQSIEQTLQMMVQQAVQGGCRPLEVKAGNGQAHGRFECQQAGTPATIDVQGTYASDRYEMTLVGTNLADRNGSGIVVPKLYMKHLGRHVGACAG